MQGSVRKKGNNWYYTIEAARINGKRNRIERAGGKTKSEALEAMRKAINEYETTGQVVDLSDISVHDYFNFWFDSYVVLNLKYNTQENYRGIIDNHILPKIGMYKLKSIKPAILQELINDKFKEGKAKQTIEIIGTVLKGAFKKAVYPHQLIKENPMFYVEMPKHDVNIKKTKDDLKIFTYSDFKKMINFVQPNNSFYIPMMIAFHTGLRRSEVCGLTWDNIDFENKTLSVDKIMVMKKKDISIGTPKTQSSYRTISLGDSIISILKIWSKRQKENKIFYGQHYTITDFVCTKENGDPVTPNSIKWSCGYVRKNIDVDFSFHSFRHTHATMLLENGAKPKEIQARLGHSRISTTLDTYSHITEKMKKETVDIFEKMLKDNA